MQKLSPELTALCDGKESVFINLNTINRLPKEIETYFEPLCAQVENPFFSNLYPHEKKAVLYSALKLNLMGILYSRSEPGKLTINFQKNLQIAMGDLVAANERYEQDKQKTPIQRKHEMNGIMFVLRGFSNQIG